MKKLFLLLLIPPICFSCKNKEPIKTYNNDSIKYFDVKSFIESEIEKVKSIPYFIYKIDVIANKKDSAVCTKDQFIAMAQPFLDADINTKDLKKYYSESVFNDLSTKSISLTYTTSNRELPVQMIAVMLNEVNQTVNRIDIRKIYKRNDSTFNESLTWKAKKSFSIVQASMKDSIEAPTKQTYIIWDDTN